LPADADRVVRELELMRSEGDKQALLLVEEIKSHSSATQRLLESRLKVSHEDDVMYFTTLVILLFKNGLFAILLTAGGDR
jgi:hypothetical protein